MPNRLVRGKWEYPRKMKRHFSMKQGYLIRNTSCHFFPFPNSLIRTKTRFVKNGTENFSRNIAIELCGPPPEVIPNIPVGRKPKQTFPFECWSKFPESLALWKATTVYHTVDVSCPVAYIKNKSWRRSNSRISGFNKQAHVSLSLLSFFNFLSTWFEVKRLHRWIWLPSARTGGVGGGVFPQGQMSP